MIKSSISSTEDGPSAKRAKLDTSSPASGTQSTESDKCYICDTTIVGKKYSLASCMTNGTKVRLVEVLGRLVCDNYMVVVSHGEYICRGCANLLNTLDRLEAEISSVKRIVLNFVERKYRLGDRLQNQQLTPIPVTYSKATSVKVATNSLMPQTQVMGKVAIPPQKRKPVVTPKKNTPAAKSPVSSALPSKPASPTKTYVTPAKTSVTSAKMSATPGTKTVTLATNATPKPTTSTAQTTPNVLRTKSYKITLKDEQVLGQSQGILQTAEEKVLNKITSAGNTPVTTPKNVWMQCNQCQYTTNQRSVMLEHLRQHVASRNAAGAGKASDATMPAKSTSVAGTSVTATASTGTPTASSAKPVAQSGSGDVNGTQAKESATNDAKKEMSTIKIVPKDTNCPPLVFSIDGNASNVTSGNKQTIIVRKADGTTITAPGIVSKMLAGNKIVSIEKGSLSQTSVTTTTTGSAVKIVSASNSESKFISKVVIPTTQQVFTSTKKAAQPEPSMPILMGDDDL